MNEKAKNILKNFSYSVSSNLITIVISTIVILIVPKFIGVEEYGYWQLYLFYSAYLGFLHFGWNDGIYLRYGGILYKDLDRKLLFSQFYLLIILQLFLGIIIVFSSSFIINQDKQFVFQMIAFNVFLINSRSMLLFILQGANEIKKSAKIIFLDRVLYIILILFFLLLDVKDYKLLVIADLIAKFVSLIHSMFYCKEIVLKKTKVFYYVSFKEVLLNINSGMKLMIANISNMLIIGIVRFGIERAWDIIVFGKISLVLSVSNLMLVFTNAIGIVIFPVLRNINEKKLSNVYIVLKNLLMPLLLGLLVFYFPVKIVLSQWLTNYRDALVYMIILFPMFVFEGKTTLLINTYLKTLRKESLMLKVNLAILLLSVGSTIYTTVVLSNLNLTVFLILFLLITRCITAELFLSKILKVKIFKDTLLELTLTLVFIYAGWYLNMIEGVFFYLIFYILYLLAKKEDIKSSTLTLKETLKKN